MKKNRCFKLFSPFTHLKWLLFITIFGFAVWWSWFRFPLPTDEEIIAHFYQHRTDIEELVKRRRAHRSQPGDKFIWISKPEIRALKKRAGIYRISGDNIGGLWLPDPYNTYKSMTSQERLDISIQEMKAGGHARWKYGGTSLRTTENNFRSTLRVALMYKELWHLPEVALIKDGLLYWPSGKTRRVSDSLDYYPLDWERGECLFRQFEPQWFIKLCRAYGGWI